MRTSQHGIAFIAAFEGVYLTPYNDPAPERNATVGIGHLLHHGPVTDRDRHARWLRTQRTPGRLTVPEAYTLLGRDLAKSYEGYVNALKLPLNQNQFDALVSFVYNLGPGSIERGTGIGRALRAHNWRDAANEMLKWDKAGGRALPGLTRRRHHERAMFLRPVKRGK